MALACELLAWMQMIALAGHARRWEPKRLRLRLRLAERWPWADEAAAAISLLQAIPSGFGAA